jgi:hypothetical protein
MYRERLCIEWVRYGKRSFMRTTFDLRKGVLKPEYVEGNTSQRRQ